MCSINACFSPPNYSIVPQIEFSNIYYGKSTKSQQDSIVLTLKFKDGDGDLGLNDSFITDSTFAFQYYYTYQGAIVNFKTKRLNPTLNLPDFITPFNCTRWEVQRNSRNVVTDTLYTKFNPNYYNISVDFYVNEVLFDPATYFIYPNCSVQGYSGRFPVLSNDPGKKSPLDGKITYSMKSFAFDVLFSIKQLKLKITIQDRALHKSNVVTTPSFTLQSIRR